MFNTLQFCWEAIHFVDVVEIYIVLSQADFGIENVKYKIKFCETTLEMIEHIFYSLSSNEIDEHMNERTQHTEQSIECTGLRIKYTKISDSLVLFPIFSFALFFSLSMLLLLVV